MEKATILVVDDTPDNLTILTSLLKERWKIKIAINGEKAIKIAQQTPGPDLILLDIMMPGMDGYEVCRILKSSPETAGIPVIFLSAKAQESDKQRGLSLGALDYLTKPINPDEVEKTVERVLGSTS
jgi:CheY-like chemotaxis protein